ncbi:hypothetical protein CEY12_05380 [Chryseobacterium sp. T16E-39]|nr:hypothetical protein CEY12_05380 [Chryseobacterium sp. T16E-39]
MCVELLLSKKKFRLLPYSQILPSFLLTLIMILFNIKIYIRLKKVGYCNYLRRKRDNNLFRHFIQGLRCNICSFRILDLMNTFWKKKVDSYDNILLRVLSA